MSQFVEETAIHSIDAARSDRRESPNASVPERSARWRTWLSDAWSIGDTPNGGYALSPVVRALIELTGRPDPLSVTTHFLRPTTAGTEAELDGLVRREGRRVTVAEGTLLQDARERLTVLAAFGELSDAGDHASRSAPRWCQHPPVSLPPPESCVDRRELEQGVGLAILDRLEVRIHPDHAHPGGAASAEMAGWVRFTDGSAPTTCALTLFADVFPPSLYTVLGEVGWVPTMELTVHIRRRPVEGWIRGWFRCEDLSGDLLIESGVLWDESGVVVAQSRQLGVHLGPNLDT